MNSTPPVSYFVRLADTWLGRSDLSEAFFAGHGHPLTDVDRQRLRCEVALDAVSGVAYGHTHGDVEFVERSLRALRTNTFL